jgi:hypothetical protein
MKKIFFIATLSLVSVFCVAASVTDETTSTKKSSVTARISGLGEDIDIDTKALAAIYDLMPQKVKKLCVSSYKSLAPQIEKSVDKRFVFEGVAIIPVKTATGINLEFSYGGHTLGVENYTKAEFDKVFGL